MFKVFLFFCFFCLLGVCVYVFCCCYFCSYCKTNLLNIFHFSPPVTNSIPEGTDERVVSIIDI